MPLVKPPIPDDTLTPFDGGVGVLRCGDEISGHVATTLGWFWSPFSPLRKQWWVWYIVVWVDGARERSTEDYPPFLAVNEMKDGHLEVLSDDPARSGRYDFAWLPSEEGQAMLSLLNISDRDF